MKAYFYIMKIHIGEEIKKAITQKGVKVSKFADRIAVQRTNIYDIYKRESIDTELLKKISVALDFNFFKLYLQDDDLLKINKEYSIESINNVVNEAEVRYYTEMKKELEEKTRLIGELEFRLSKYETVERNRKYA